jgi:hypothetical protein
MMGADAVSASKTGGDLHRNVHRFRNMSSGEHSISVICWMRRRLIKKVTRSNGSILTSKRVENIVARKLG